MTNHIHGSSLLQARKSHLHRHSHLHDREAGHVRSQEELHERQEADLDSAVTEVVQTISVVQVIDGTGATVSLQTLWSDPQTNLIDPSTGATLDASVPNTVTATPAVDSASSLISDATSLLSVSTSDLAQSTTVSSISQATSQSLTAAPLTTSSLFPSLGTAFNSTNSLIASSHPFANSTRPHSLFANSTTTSTSSSTSFSSSWTSTSSSKSKSTSKFSSTSSTSSDLFVTPAATGGSGDDSGSAGTGGVTAAVPTTTDLSSSASQDSNSIPTSQVVGGVVGGIAGLAILVFLALLILRWKKRQGAAGQALLGPSGDNSGFRALPSSGGPQPPSSPGAPPNAMAERTFPFAIPATLASLTGKRSSQRRSAMSGTESGERGFHRVSGKKLPSVLQYGGDGFTDPRESAMSGTSFYRDSMAFFNQIGTPGAQRFAVGSPMRPESGVPVIHQGAARTPVTEQGPFFDLPDTPPPPNPNLTDPLGRSLISQDSSRGSGSRFTENI
ncbi:hypothetical protein NKR23_g7937 [Pleurostoma richardsiae]|uniref:Uncharacterized protein n=1 Tax=Pleurostoma richardsiae TaxID=41990 RepID=A0AA38VMB4_9PEZI|nr:hypothetical protein NKR23_g7937 [Pleurostoma richardsiae]